MKDQIITRAAVFEPSTYNAEKRTVQVVFSTGAEVMRADWEGPYIERLSMEPAAVDLSQLKGGPVLDNHDRFTSVRAVLGVVTDASVDGKRGLATIQFSERPEVQGLARDVQQGIIRNVSAGYTVQKWEVSKRADGVRIKTGVRWTPKEVSFTPLSADSGAQTRSATMNEELQQRIRSLVELSGLPGEFAEGLITRNVASIEDARTAVFAEVGRRAPVIENRAPAVVTREAGDNLVTRMADGLLARVNPKHKPEQGREFVYTRIPDLARRCLELRGLSTLGAPAEILTRAMHTTSDFANVLSEVFNKNLLMLGAEQPAAVMQLFKRATVPDFRLRHIMEISDGPGLEKVSEKGEIQGGTITDAELSNYRIDSYARLFAITFKALVNDDANALGDLSGKMNRGARQWFASFLVDTIIANPALKDGKAVFHADHGNLETEAGTGPSDTAIQRAKNGIRLQTDLSGNPLNIPPKFIVAPVALEGVIDQLLATLYPTSSTTAETAARGLAPVVDARFDVAGEDAAWYLFADPATAPVFEYAELQGYEGPRVEVEQGFDVLGTKIRVVWHVGAGAIDSRGAWKNPGE